MSDVVVYMVPMMGGKPCDIPGKFYGICDWLNNRFCEISGYFFESPILQIVTKYIFKLALGVCKM